MKSFTISFFFSSRRRHTRSKRDWSSDVCSSDLVWRDKSTNTLMIQSQNRQAVPHRLQDLHAVGIAQAGKEESICTSIQGRHFAPGHCSKEFDLVLKMQGFCALLPRLAHFTVTGDHQSRADVTGLCKCFERQGQGLSR